MKIFILVPCLLLTLTVAMGQDSIKNNLYKLLNNAKTGSQKALVLSDLSKFYAIKKPDSAILFAEQSLFLSQKNNLLPLQAISLLQISTAFRKIGNLAGALDAGFKALEIEKELKDSDEIRNCYGYIGIIFKDESDLKKAIQFTLKAQEIIAIDGSHTANWIYLLNLSQYYLALNQLDSSLHYAQRAYEIALHAKDIRIYLIMLQLGSIQDTLHNTSLAISYYRLSQQSASAHDFPGIYSVYQQLATFFYKTGAMDSSIFYAKKALQKCRATGNIRGLLDASQLLSQLYDNRDIPKAFEYYKIATEAKDSMFSIEKIKQLQIITTAQELKEQEETEEKSKEEESRRHAVQIAGIAIFIPMFFIIVMLMGQLRARPRVVEFLGVLSLLFVFEFITLVTHPFLEKWTNDTPVLMLLILVGLAMFLVPMHHRIEHWMKGKLVNHKQAQHAVQPVQTELAQQATDVGDDFVIENSELEDDVA